MHESVAAAFPTITVAHEDDIPHMYRDSLGLVTVAIGQLIEDRGTHRLQLKALDWPWTLGNGYPATDAEVAAEFDRVKASRNYQADQRAARQLATMHLPHAARLDILRATLAANERHLVQQLPDWGTWPADAQLAMLSATWNLGTSLTGWPTLWQRLRARDWLYASDNYIPRDAAGRPVQAARWTENRLLWTHAAFTDSDLGRSVYGQPRSELLMGQVTISLRWVAKSGEASRSAWYVQRQLKAVGMYAAGLDGLFGPRSLAGLEGFRAAQKITAPALSTTTLTRLGRAAQLNLPVEE